MRYQAEGGIYAGNLLIDVFVNGARSGAERDVGECSAFTINAMKITEKVKKGHRIENFGDNVESAILEKPQDMKFTLGDNANKKNLAMAMFGEDSVISQVDGTVTAESVTASLGNYAKLAKLRVKPTPAVEVVAPTPDEWQATHAYVLTNFVEPATPNTYRYECTTAGTSAASEPTWPTTPGQTVTDGTVVWTCRKMTYVLDADYEMEYEAGMILPLEDGDIPDGQELEVDYSYDDYTGYNIKASTQSKIDAYLRLVGKNINTGKRCMVIVHKASLIPTGAIDFITEDYGKLEFTGNIMSIESGDTWEVIALD